MSLQSPTYEIAKANHKDMVRRPMKRRSSAIPYGSNSLGARKKKATKKVKKLSDGKLKKKVWKEFSIFIRSRRADSDGITKCVTCAVRKHWKEMQAGHFLRGRLNSNLFDERGTNEQCYACNVGRDGNVVEYYEWMLVNHSKEVIDELRQKNNVTHKWQPGELIGLLSHYKELNAANPLLAEVLSDCK